MIGFGFGFGLGFGFGSGFPACKEGEGKPQRDVAHGRVRRLRVERNEAPVQGFGFRLGFGLGFGMGRG